MQGFTQFVLIFYFIRAIIIIFIWVAKFITLVIRIGCAISREFCFIG